MEEPPNPQSDPGEAPAPESSTPGRPRRGSSGLGSGSRRREPRPGEEALAQLRRRHRRIWILRGLIFLLLLGVGGVAYLQSSDALRRILLPLAARGLGTQISAADGDLSLGGRLWLQDVLVQGSDGQPAFSATRVAVQVRPLSLMGGGPPEIVSLEAEQPRLRVAVDRFGRSNWNFKPEEPAASTAAESGAPRSPRPFPELRIDQATIRDLGLVYEEADGLRVAITDLDLSAAGLRRGNAGALALDLAAEVARPGEGLREALNLQTSGTLTQHADGEQLAWDATLAAQARNLASQNAAFSDVAFDLKGKGNLASSGKLEQGFTLAAHTPQGRAGNAEGEVTWDPAQDLRRAKIKLEKLTREALNPLLAIAAPVQLDGGLLHGNLTLDGTGKLVAFRADLTGEKLLARRGQGPASAPLDFTARNGGSINLERSLALLSEIQWQVLEAGRPVLSLGLNQPTELAYGDQNGGLAQAAARIQLKADQLPVSTLRPLLALAGAGDVMADLRGGSLSSDLALDVERGGQGLAIHGQWRGEGLRLDAMGPDPLRIWQELDGTLDQLHALTLRSSKLHVEREGRELLNAQLSGKHDLKTADGAWEVQATLPQVIAGINGLAGQQVLRVAGLQDGRLVASSGIKLDAAKRTVSLEGSAEWAGAKLALKGGSAPLDARAQYKLALSQQTGRLEIASAALQLTGSREQGTVEASGSWPLGFAQGAVAASEPGQLQLKVRRVDLGPWLVLLGALAGEQVPCLPLEADEALTAEKGGRLRLKGEARIGLPESADGSGPLLTAEIKHALDVLGDRVEDLLVDLSTSGAGPGDQLKLSGNGNFGEKTDFKLATQVEMLDVDRLLTRIQMLSGQPLETANASEAAASPTPPAAEASEANARGPAPRVVSTLDIKRLLYSGNELAAAQGQAQWENRVLTVKLDQGRLNGGTLTGQTRIELDREPARYAWDFKTQQAPISPLVALGSPDAAQRISGKADITSRGTAEGSGEQLKRSLQSDTQFEIRDGALNNNVLLDALAQQTLVESFRAMKFIEILGGVKANNGTLEFQECLVRGPSHRIDLKGNVDLLRNSYRFEMVPAVGETLAKQIPGNRYIPQLVRNAGGFLRFPFGVNVRGEGGRYVVTPSVGMPVALGGVAGKVTGGVTGAVNEGVGLAVEGGRDAVEGVFRGVGGLLDRKATSEREQQPLPGATEPGTMEDAQAPPAEAPNVSSGAVDDLSETTATATPTPRPKEGVKETVKDAGKKAGETAKDAVGDVVKGIGGLLKR